MTDPTHHPGRLLAISGSYWQASTLHAAVELDIFTAIDSGARTRDDVARAVKADPRAAGMLLNALAAMQLLVKTGEAFANTAESRRYLVRSSPDYVGYIIGHHHHLVSGWNRLDEAVREGRPVRERIAFEDQTVRRNFLLGMYNLASLLAPQVARRIDLSGRQRLLDLGGGPGTYAVHFCRRNAQLEAVVYDRPTTRPFAEDIIARHGLDKRIAFQAGDYLSDPIPGNFDVAWVSHILHAEDQKTGSDLLAKLHATLVPGGVIYVHDFLMNENLDGPLFPALFSLNMLQGTSGGQSYSRGQIESMLQAAGFREPAAVALESPNDSGIVAAAR
jgi:SAM-dependent methyltransferase